MTDTPRVGLVLGAGGITGQAFHSGFLAGLADATGWDARDASVVVGTSAGSWVATYLRFGISGPDLAAAYADEPMTPEGKALADRQNPDPSPPLPEGGRLRLGVPSIPSLLGAARAPCDFRLIAVLAAALTPGPMPTTGWAESLHGLTGDAWPDRPLWIPALRRRDARRVVFGRDDRTPSVAAAVAASSAVPGYCEPAVIDGVEYIDGAAYSPTNADLLRDTPEKLDLAIVSSPMSASEWTGASERALHSLRLALETWALRRAGIPTVVFAPDAETLDVLGPSSRDRARRPAVVHHVRELAATRAESGAFAALTP
ncbi:MAG: putative esterase of the alpha-beta hydrolase superfamily [Actinomycetia bacterium]|nr:putative esterase of the alpha-beta hydrolase superfamily [Actinomycetes bacterium]